MSFLYKGYLFAYQRKSNQINCLLEVSEEVNYICQMYILPEIGTRGMVGWLVNII